MRFFELYSYVYYRVYTWAERVDPKKNDLFPQVILMMLLIPTFFLIITILDIVFGLNLSDIIDILNIYKYFTAAILLGLCQMLKIIMVRFNYIDILKIRFDPETQHEKKRNMIYVYILFTLTWSIFALLATNEKYLHAIFG
jgi:hypothetical protein